MVLQQKIQKEFRYIHFSFSYLSLQVPLKASSLNSADSFVLQTLNLLYIWYGKGCEPVEREYAVKIAQFLNTNGSQTLVIEEGKEPEDFWNELGGKTEYQNSPELQDGVKEPRLFHCSNATGKYEVCFSEYQERSYINR